MSKPPFDPATVQPPTEDQQRYENQKRFWERQIRIAKCLNWITAVAAIVGLVGLLILKESLDATRKAADAARDSADAAKRSVENAEKAFQLDQRAWVSIGPINVFNSP